MVNLTHEAGFLQKIGDLAANGKILNSAKLTATGNGSGLTMEEAESKIRKLLPTTRQRVNAAKFYLAAIENMDYAPYLGGQHFLSEEQKPLIDFLDSDLQVQINVLNSDTFLLIVFIVLNGFFSNLVSLEDCVAKIINIVYDLLQDDRFSYKIRQELENKTPTGNLTAHLRAFHVVDQNGDLDKTGSPFNIAREIRNQLVHDEIGEIVFFPTLSLLGFPNTDLYFNNLFFPANTPPKHSDTEIIAFCKDVYQKTVDFVDECYRLIRADLQQNGVLPV